MTDTPRSPLGTFSGAVAAIAKAAAGSVVAIEHGGRIASGFHWRPEILVTASDAMTAPGGTKVVITTAAGTDAEGTVIGHDPSTDIALVRVAQPVQTAMQAAAGDVELGQTVVVLGRNTHGATFALGSVALAAGAWRSMRGGEISQRVWLDVRLQRSAQGAAVLDNGGRFLGMAVAGHRRRVVLIPSATIDRVAPELVANGRIARGYLGVAVQPVAIAAHRGNDGEADARGLLVVALEPGGPAAAAGLHQGDILVSVAGERPRSPRALSRTLTKSMIGTAVPIEVVRAGQTVTIPVTIVDRSTA